ncbi:DegT/DnrJ/EryC1/StrS family aminotransferase [Thermodesulfobacteriota bacterium]
MIPFVDLAAQQKLIDTSLKKRIHEVLSHGSYIMGPEVSELEEKLSHYAGVKHTIACSSGTDALLMSLMAYGIGPGDAIFTTPFTFISTAEVIALLGATPIFVDIEPKTFNMDPSHLELAIRAVSENDPKIYPIPRSINNPLSSKGIIPVDLFGLPADYDQINGIAKRFGLFVLGDAAQSFGGVYQGKKVGGLADISATSFFPAKPLGCYGDGGAVLTDNDELADIMKSIRVHGKGKNKYENTRIGINGRLDTFQAAILLEKLEIFPGEIAARNRTATRYSRGLEDLLQTPHIPNGSTSAWAQFSIVTEKREELQAALKKSDIPTAIYYPKPLHLQEAFSDLEYRAGDFPVSEKTARNIFSLPMHPYLEDEIIDRIVTVIRSAMA